jgi:hypothetical protein
MPTTCRGAATSPWASVLPEFPSKASKQQVRSLERRPKGGPAERPVHASAVSFCSFDFA